MAKPKMIKVTVKLDIPLHMEMQEARHPFETVSSFVRHCILNEIMRRRIIKSAYGKSNVERQG